MRDKLCRDEFWTAQFCRSELWTRLVLSAIRGKHLITEYLIAEYLVVEILLSCLRALRSIYVWGVGGAPPLPPIVEAGGGGADSKRIICYEIN